MVEVPDPTAHRFSIDCNSLVLKRSLLPHRMRISHSHRFIFFAVPRTGSTTVRKVLDDYSDVKSIHISETTEANPFYHHISPRETIKIFESRGWDWKAYKKFCFVRNPFDRAVSLFHHRLKMRRKQTGWMHRVKQKAKLFLHRRRMFAAFVNSHMRDWGRLEEPVTSFITDSDGNCLVDDVLRFEEMRSELPAYLNKLGIEISPEIIPHKNKSKRKSNYKYYNGETKNYC